MRRVTACVLAILFLLSGCPFTAFAADGSAAAYAYPQDDVLQIDLVMQPYHYLYLTHSRRRKEHPAVVSIDGGPVQEIAVRVRGTMSLDDGMNFASKRIPMELCFDYYNSGEKLYRNNSSLKLINCITPARLLVQLIAMQAFRFLGVPTPRMQPAFVRINDVDFGLYLAVEDLNEDFVRDHFGTGSLYRKFNGRELENGEVDTTDAQVAFDGVQMKVKVDQGTETIRHCAQSLSRGESIEPYLDTDELLRFLACEMFVFDKDGIQYLKNCYFLEYDGRLSALPWDQSEAFLAFHEDVHDGGLYPDYEDRYRQNTAIYRELLQNDAYYAQYRAYVRKLNDEFLNPDIFLPWLESYIRYLSPFFQRDNSIGLRSAHMAADLTSGTGLYGGMSGNLLQTFRVYHDQTDEILSGQAERYTVPDGLSVGDDSRSKAQEAQIYGTDHSIVFRICTNYWKMRRQAYLQKYETAITVSGGLFAAVFLLTVVSVKMPKGKKPRGSPAKEGET